VQEILVATTPTNVLRRAAVGAGEEHGSVVAFLVGPFECLHSHDTETTPRKELARSPCRTYDG
jgi:hypothetical protein